MVAIGTWPSGCSVTGEMTSAELVPETQSPLMKSPYCSYIFLFDFAGFDGVFLVEEPLLLPVVIRCLAFGAG
ncbi:hypothetical protein D3C76_938190 [compost metagenome]